MLDLDRIKQTLAQFEDTVAWGTAGQNPASYRQQVVLLAAYMGEHYVRPLVDEVERLRRELGDCKANNR